MKKCPYCKNDVEDSVSKCPYCGAEIGMVNNVNIKSPLTNGFKVFITLVSVIPLIGQLIGIITGIIFMNSKDDYDRRSFGKALLIAAIIMFVLSCCCIAYFVFSFYAAQKMYPDIFEQFQQFQ